MNVNIRDEAAKFQSAGVTVIVYRLGDPTATILVVIPGVPPENSAGNRGEYGIDYVLERLRDESTGRPTAISDINGR